MSRKKKGFIDCCCPLPKIKDTPCVPIYYNHPLQDYSFDFDSKICYLNGVEFGTIKYWDAINLTCVVVRNTEYIKNQEITFQFKER